MSRRKRKYIPYPERLAAALAELLPVEMQVDLRARRVSCRHVIRLFTPDHIVLHAPPFNGSDKWWNLHMRLRGADVLAKNAKDTTVVAKTKRVARAHADFVRRVLGPVKRRRRRPARKPFKPTPVKVLDAS